MLGYMQLQAEAGCAWFKWSLKDGRIEGQKAEMQETDVLAHEISMEKTQSGTGLVAATCAVLWPRRQLCFAHV